MTRDVEERSQMATTRQAGSIGAQLITGMAFVPVVLMFASPHEGFFAASIVMSIIGVIGFAISTAMNMFRSSAILRMNRKRNSRTTLNSCLLINRFCASF